MRWIYRLSLSLVLLGFVQGCGFSRPAGPDYQTVSEDPRRDTDLARRRNAEAIRLIDEGKLQEAEQVLKAALDADVMFGPAHNNLGLVYHRQSRLYLAAWEFQHAIKLTPYHPEPQNNLGLIFEAVGKLDKAIDHYEEALSLQPDNPQLVGNLARARFRRGDRGEKMRELLRDVVMKDTRPPWVGWAKEKLALIGSK